MILDSSAIVAIATEEPGCLDLLDKLDQAETLAVGAPTLVETALVLRSRLTLEPRVFLDRFLTDWNVSVVPFGEDHWKVAVDAHARFGRGHHKAALNLGDLRYFHSFQDLTALGFALGDPKLNYGRERRSGPEF